MISYIRLLLEYNTYCVWLYNDNNEVIDNDNPPELDDDKELTDAFLAVSDLYDTFFIDNEHEFTYKGCPDDATRQELINRINHAVQLLYVKNDDKYPIKNDIKTDF